MIALGGILTSDIVKIEYRGIYQSYFNLVSHVVLMQHCRSELLPCACYWLSALLFHAIPADDGGQQAYGAGHGLGAALGGFLCDHLGWRAAFSVQLPFIATYGALAILSCPENLGPNLAKTEGKTLGEAFESFDSYGTIGMILVVTGLILGVNLGGNVFS